MMVGITRQKTANKGIAHQKSCEEKEGRQTPEGLAGEDEQEQAYRQKQEGADKNRRRGHALVHGLPENSSPYPGHPAEKPTQQRAPVDLPSVRGIVRRGVSHPP